MKLLIVEDEKGLRESIEEYFAEAGNICETASSFAEALTKVSLYRYDCILLDITLPGGNGIDILKTIKQKEYNDGILIISAKNSLDDRLEGLDLGADDYVTKPFDTEELLARVRGALRRRGGVRGAGLVLGDIAFDPATRRITRNGAELHLTPKEYALFAELARHPGRVVTHGHLLAAIWGPAHVGDVEYLRVTMRGLRAKLEADPAQPKLLINDPGIGYRLVAG